MSSLLRNLRQLRQYPTAIAGMVIILFLVVISVGTVIFIPYSEAIARWRGTQETTVHNPRNAAPTWTNWFRSVDLPETTLLSSSGDESIVKQREQISADLEEVVFTFEFDFESDVFVPEMALFLQAEFENKPPFVEMLWITPDGREIRAGEITPKKADSFRFSQDSRLQRRLRGQTAEVGLFADPDSEEPVPLKGTYKLQLTALLFEEGSDIDADLILYGNVHGWAGTDHRRRDLSTALLWGTPIAMAFGLLAAVGTTITTMSIAAIGVWFGGWLDAIIQRVTEINLILPVLPILIMIGTFYSRSIWAILGVVILLSIFGASIKTYRAIFLQVRELPYIEAAQAYGAGNMRIIFRYLIPRILPLLIPQLVALVPSFVFLEASLAVLGLGDPVLPTWGKVIQDANAQGALFNGYYYWILEPAALLMIAGIGFAMVGFALDRIFNPRLREV